MTNITCPWCNEGQLVEKTKAETCRRGSLDLHFDKVYSECSSCGSTLVSGDQLDRNQRNIVRAEGIALNAPSPESIRNWRKAWGITQADAGRMFRVGPSAFSKYENGVLTPSGPTCALFDLVINSQTATSTMAARCNVDLAPEESAPLFETLPNQMVCTPIRAVGAHAQAVMLFNTCTMARPVTSQKTEPGNAYPATVTGS